MTEHEQRDRRSDAEREDAAYYHSKILQTALAMFVLDDGTTPLERSCARALKSRLADKVTEFGGSTWRGDIFANAAADRDRQFVEAVREAMDAGRSEEHISTRLVMTHNIIHEEHERIYGTPCTAKEKA